MNKIYGMTLAVLMCGVAVPGQSQVQQDCNNNTTGRRKSIQCTFTQPNLGMVWKGSAGRARKLYINKPAGDTGQEVVRLWINGNLAGEVIINPGFSGNIFRKKGESTIAARVEVETLQLPTAGASTIYVHFETLDPPVMPDLSSCSNPVTADRQSACWSGNF